MPKPTTCRPWRFWPAALALAAGLASGQAPTAPTANSSLDGPLFYQLLLGELDLRQGNLGSAYARFLDVAQRTRDEALFRRTVEIALQARAGDQSLAAARAWRIARPESLDAVRFELQILVWLNRVPAMAEPLKTLLARSPEPERALAMAGISRFVSRAGDKRQMASMLESVLQPYTETAATRTAARLSIARAWWLAEDAPKALALADSAQADDVKASGPALLALELMGKLPAAEALVTRYLAQTSAEPNVRLAYVKALTSAQRYSESRIQLLQVTREHPQLPGPWLTLGAIQLELREPREAQTSLLRYLSALDATPPNDAASTSAHGAPVNSDNDDEDEDEEPSSADARKDDGRTQAWLMLAQAAEMQGDLKAASAWVDKIVNPQQALDVQTRRATLLARQGKLAEAKALIRQTPERRPEDARLKLLAESQMLREVKRWPDAHAVLQAANDRFKDDVELLYEQAMLAEKLSRTDEMERLLRRVIELKPDHYHSYNALGYSLADRNTRLPEARTLVFKALELSPNDPFITDSAGWVEYRMGNHAQALIYLKRAYAARPDTEIGAHLGEVLWVSGARDEARKVWREARERDSQNEVLRETLARLQVKL